MEIRTATISDIDAIANVESLCFPQAEAATREQIAERVKAYGNHFWLMFDEGKLIGFVDGMVTDEADLTDEMYEKADMHNEQGQWQMNFNINQKLERKKYEKIRHEMACCDYICNCRSLMWSCNWLLYGYNG